MGKNVAEMLSRETEQRSTGLIFNLRNRRRIDGSDGITSQHKFGGAYFSFDTSNRMVREIAQQIKRKKK